MTLPILVVDDEQSMREFLSILLERQGFTVHTAESGDDAVEKIGDGRNYRMVLTDLKMPGSRSGIDVLKHVRAVDDACQVVVMTAFATPETAISAIKIGAYDYITKPFKVDEAKVAVERAIEKYDLLSENVFLKRRLTQVKGSSIIGRSAAMQNVFDMIRKVAPSKTTVLITGESGTGKELVAKELHTHSTLKGEFIAVNCGAIPENLIEAELFGYKKGAFTGANTDRDGLFTAAVGGTLFLDEIGELPIGTQVRLLRAIQEKKIKPVGDVQESSVDVRIVAATNRDLSVEVKEGRFREDLFYRLNVIPIELPPLRERDSDIRLLLEHFIGVYAREIGRNISDADEETWKILTEYRYPGNVRELQNIIERAMTLESSNELTIASLPPRLTGRVSITTDTTVSIGEDGVDLDAILAGVETRYIEEALRMTGGNRTEAAKILGISFRSIRYRLQKLNPESDA